MFDFSDEKKKKYFDRAEETLKAAGFGMLKIDRTKVMVCRNEKIQIHMFPWFKTVLPRERLKDLKAMPEFTVVHDRFSRWKPGQEKPLKGYELGYITLELDECDR